MRLVKTFTLPAGLDCQEITIRELTGKDDITIAVWTEQRVKGDSALKENFTAALGVEMQEAMRCSIVAVDGVPADGPMGFRGMDDWSKRTMRFLQDGFNDINGVDSEDLKKFRSSAVVVNGQSAGKDVPAT